MNKCEPPDLAGKYQRDFKQCFLEQKFIQPCLEKKKICFVNVIGRMLSTGWEGSGGAGLCLRAERGPHPGQNSSSCSRFSKEGHSFHREAVQWCFLEGLVAIACATKIDAFPRNSEWMPGSDAWPGVGRDVPHQLPEGISGTQRGRPKGRHCWSKCRTWVCQWPWGCRDTEFSGNRTALS